MKAAQDATMLANQERLKWQEKIKDLETQRQNLQEKEYRLLARAQDLENFTQVIIMNCVVISLRQMAINVIKSPFR